MNTPNVVVPPDEIENVMAPSNLKKKKGAHQRKPAVTPVVETSGPTAAGPAPVLHVANHRRSSLQDYPLPSAYVGTKPLQTDHTAHGSCNPLQPGSTSHVQPPAHPVQPPAHPLKPTIKPSAHPVESRALPVESRACPVQYTGTLALANRSHQQYSDPFWVVLLHLSAKMEMEDYDMEKNWDTDLEENLDITFEEDNGEEIQDADFREDNGEEDANIDLEEDEIDTAIAGEEHEDGHDLGDGDLYGTVTDPIDNSNPEDHIYHLGQAEKHVNNGARKQAGCPQANSKQAPLRAKEVPNINYNLLQHHYLKNHRPRSPSPSYLTGVCGQQSNLHPKPKCPRKNDPSPANDGSNCDDDNEFECDSVIQSCATKKNKNANFRQHLAIVAPFPQCESAIDKGGVCREMIAEAIVYWQEQKRQLEKGYYLKFKAEMAIVNFNDTMTFRSKIKQVALAMVPLEYELVSQGGTIAAVKVKASSLIHHSLFLCGVVDAHGHSSNFAHNTFQSTILDNTVILVATIVNIYMHGQANTKQMNIVDSEVIYQKIASLFKCVKDDEYHGPKLHKMLQSWTQTGMNEVAMSDKDEDGGSEWEVDLY
ncbi:hypothetical protein BDR05DRAFT_1004979 [Suillus weaverae]|nr:hypothetical protein BDR05DRAFT_1004979 [Suillus weaverae]